MPPLIGRGDGRSHASSLLLTTDAVGGVWRYTIDLARACPGSTVAVLGPPPSPAQRVEAAGLDLIETGLPLDWTAADPDALAAATDALKRLPGDSVHLHAPALVGAARWDRPVVAVAHSCVATWWRAVRGGALPDDFRWRTALTGSGLHAADAVIAPSRAHAAAVRVCYGDLPIAAIHNGASSACAVNGAQPAVLTAGRLWDEGKNAAALDRAAPRVGAPVRAAGPLAGPNGAAIELPNLQYLGTLDAGDMARAFADATVFASLAVYEPFGLAVLEAARAGLRLVLSDIPSFRELWDGAALFVRPGEDPVPALRAALAAGPDDCAKRRAACYTLPRMINATIALHRRVAA